MVKLPDYKSYKKNIEFLKQLHEILELKIPIEKSPNTNGRSMVEITELYAFTPDNFVKMILILMIIRDNIPVIMMGETGCGKTFLIKKLAYLIQKMNLKKNLMTF